MPNEQKINQILQSLQLREESTNQSGLRVVTCTITGTDRLALLGNLVSHTFNYDDNITIRFANATTDGLTYTTI